MTRPPARRIALFGATGTIGRATATALVARGDDVVAFLRAVPRSGDALSGISARTVDVADPAALSRAFGNERFDAVISCMASRTGTPADAWAIDHRAQSHVLMAAQAAGVAQFILLSAICVQKPLLAFQHAKLAFESELMASGMRWSIVRPTAFFKSLSGQIERVRAGKRFLLFGDGQLTACKPISNRDLAEFIVECLDYPSRWNRILPIGGPGEAITPRQQGETLFALLDRKPRFRSVPVGLLDAIIATLSTLGRFAPRLAAKAELARIGRYYATESMLLIDPLTGRYDAAATPSTGSDRLEEFYRSVVSGDAALPDRGDHGVF